jgi:hypothetical protein
MTEPTKPIACQTLRRPEAIELIRAKLEALTDREHCVCDAAGRLGIFCGGFRGLSDAQFRKRFDWIAHTRPDASRAELERLVSLYHAGRQEVTGARLCCDLETREHCACDGWNAFDNRALERLCRDLAGRDVKIL